MNDDTIKILSMSRLLALVGIAFLSVLLFDDKGLSLLFAMLMSVVSAHLFPVLYEVKKEPLTKAKNEDIQD